GLELAQHRALLAYVGHRQFDVLSRHRVHECQVLRSAFALERGGHHRRANLEEQSREVAQLDVVDGALDRAAGRVATDQDYLCASYIAHELHAAEDVLVCNVASHAGVEDVADAEVQNDLCGCSRIDAA